jgi:glycosyltransferase involved in cell wall biosynthesis
MGTPHQPAGCSPMAHEKGEPMRKPRVLYVITRAERGGAQVHLLDLAVGMGKKFELHLATGEEGYLTQACRENGIAVHLIPHLQREIRPLNDLKAAWELRRLMRRIKPDLVHAHTFKAGFLGRFVANRLKIPAIYTAHMWPFGAAVPLTWRLVAPVCERLAARWCDRIISVSALAAENAARHGIGERSQVVPILNGIFDHPLRASLDHDKPDHDKPDHDKALTCTMVARFTHFKDHELLLRAFAQVSGQVSLRLVGDGETLAAAHKLADELGIGGRVKFEGARGDVPEILAQSDIFVLASRTETLPISILEAMRSGLPVIASDVGGVSEEVIDGKTGILVTAGSVDEMAAALTGLLADKAMRIAMGRAGRRRFEQLFRAGEMIERTRAVYTEVWEERFDGRFAANEGFRKQADLVSFSRG